jgi:hypothetical protein
MVRLMLVLAPVMCVLSGIGISAILNTYMRNLESSSSSKLEKKVKKSEDYPKKPEVFFLIKLHFFWIHYSRSFCFDFLISVCSASYSLHVLLAGQLHIPLHLGHLRGLLESFDRSLGQELQW